MKRLVSLALSAALVLSLLAGCGNSTDPQTTGTATTGGNEGTGEAKDTIVWAQSGDINSLDFHVGKQYLSYGVTCNIFDTLVSWDADNNVIPMLATEWEFLDEDSIQFKLREGVTFHDGEPFTAEDVKYTYERARDHTIVKNNFSWLESVDVVDDYTVVINTIGAYSPVLNALCSPLCGITTATSLPSPLATSRTTTTPSCCRSCWTPVPSRTTRSVRPYMTISARC